MTSKRFDFQKVIFLVNIPIPFIPFLFYRYDNVTTEVVDDSLPETILSLEDEEPIDEIWQEETNKKPKRIKSNGYESLPSSEQLITDSRQ